MIDPAALAALAAVLRTGSFEGAAADLRLTQSAISQRVKTLEDRLGTALVRRTRPATATVAGARLLQHAEEISLLDRRLAADLGGLLPTPDTPLRIAVTADSLATWLLPALAAVPDLLFDLVIDDQDHSAELLRQGAVAAAVTLAGGAVPGCDAHALGSLRYRAYCAPAFAARWFADGVTADRLGAAPALTFNQKDTLQRQWVTQATGGKPRLKTHYIPETNAITQAAIAGIGWGMNPTSMVDPLIAAGHLTEIIAGQTLDTPLIWQVPRQNRDALADLTRAMRRAARGALVPA